MNFPNLPDPFGLNHNLPAQLPYAVLPPALPTVHPDSKVFSMEKLKQRVEKLLKEDRRLEALDLNVAVQRALRYPMQSLIAAGLGQIENLNCQCAACQAKRAAGGKEAA